MEWMGSGLHEDSPRRIWCRHPPLDRKIDRLPLLPKRLQFVDDSARQIVSEREATRRPRDLRIAALAHDRIELIRVHGGWEVVDGGETEEEVGEIETGDVKCR